jgi:NAD(P)H dehydrogenase (quinone)
MATIAIVYHSIYGHTKLQAEAVARGAQSVSGVTVQTYTAEEATNSLDDLDKADAIIFGCPTYMGSMSAGMKSFIEAAAKKWFTLAWKNKIAGAFTNSSSFSGDKLNTLVGLFINAMQHGMIFVGLGMHPAPNKPEEMAQIEGPGPEAHNRVGSLETAEAYGKRVAEITLLFLR